MPSGWEVYYLVFLSAILATGLPASFALLSRLFSGSSKSPHSSHGKLKEKSEPLAELRINTRFFLAANVALGLICLGVILIPCVAALINPDGKLESVRGLYTLIVLAGFAGVALLYSIKKGDLRWLETYRQEDNGGES